MLNGKRKIMSVGFVLAASGIALLVWLLIPGSDNRTGTVSAEAIIVDACNLNAVSDYDVTMEAVLNNFHGGGVRTESTSKFRISANGYHEITSGKDSPGAAERIFLYDVGIFTRRMEADGEWRPWQTQYFKDEEKELFKANSPDGSFCGRVDLYDVKFNKDDELDGLPVKRYVAYGTKLTTLHGGTAPDSYEKLEYWIDGSGKVLRLDQVMFIEGKDYDRKLKATHYLSGFGQPNPITAPEIDETPEPVSPLLEQMSEQELEEFERQLTEQLQAAGLTPEEIEAELEELGLK